MAVPKRKTSKSRKNLRRSHHALAAPARAKCPQCGAARLPHRVCRECGFYSGATRIEIAEEE
jgi:large subunit ribosomal protein L32